MAAHMESVILIEVTGVSPNFLQPWKMHGQRQSSGSDYKIIKGNFYTIRGFFIQPAPRCQQIVDMAIDCQIEMWGLLL